MDSGSSSLLFNKLNSSYCDSFNFLLDIFSSVFHLLVFYFEAIVWSCHTYESGGNVAW